MPDDNVTQGPWEGMKNTAPPAPVLPVAPNPEPQEHRVHLLLDVSPGLWWLLILIVCGLIYIALGR